MGLYIGNTRYKAIVNGIAHKVITKLPYDAEIEYIESSTGTEVIDTGIVPNESTKVQFRFTNIEATGTVIIGYIYDSDKNDWRLFNKYNRAYFDAYGGSDSFGKRINGGSIIPNTIYNLEMGNYYIKDLETGENIISGDVYTGTGTNTIYINGNNGHSSKNRWYYIKIYDGTTLVRDFIPVRVVQVGYMYDKVSGQLFSNAGTGDFILGNDKNS